MEENEHRGQRHPKKEQKRTKRTKAGLKEILLFLMGLLSGPLGEG